LFEIATFVSPSLFDCSTEKIWIEINAINGARINLAALRRLIFQTGRVDRNTRAGSNNIPFELFAETERIYVPIVPKRKMQTFLALEKLNSILVQRKAENTVETNIVRDFENGFLAAVSSIKMAAYPQAKQENMSNEDILFCKISFSST
jgi:hypothetical protein